jgi:hypothetical protein
LDVLIPESTTKRHFTINGVAGADLEAEDLEYLRRKGCFDLPEESDSLLAAYFHYVHPLFPVLDGPLFLQVHADGGLETMNLLLLWSVFSISASYVPAYSDAGTKGSFVRRAKALFDLSRETDKIVLIQSALLLSFWFDDVEDVKQSWYWTGIAFSIAQALGLHIPLSSDAQEPQSKDRGQWNTVWQCCILRDAWLSYSMGRPLRLDDVARNAAPQLSTSSRFENMKFKGSLLYSPDEEQDFGKMWLSALTTVRILRQCLSADSPQHDVLSMCLLDSLQYRKKVSSNILVSLCDNHLQLCQYAAVIALCQAGDDGQMAEVAADGIMGVIRSYQGGGTVPFVPPSIVPLVMPAMLVSISAIRSSDEEAVALGKGRLSACLTFLSSIESTYPAAGIVKKLFTAVHDAVRPDPARE